MSRKNNFKFRIVKDKDLGASFDTFANPSYIEDIDNVGIALFWAIAASPVGQFEVWVSNDPGVADPAAVNQKPVNWVKLDFGATITIDSSQQSHVINMTQLSYTWMAIKYISTSGGALDLMNAYATFKSVGA